ncbi:MAG: MoxR family ATPase, partial [Geodermatophilaceae bacterium]|nr:MoxR family ATPase [Geodermatophilaceae bacterium]
VTGVSVYNQDTRDFEFKPGAVFANLVVGDEINRASPKTQSALLECMEERQVTVDGTTYFLESPFMVVATQNPIEMEGTYPLPEAQRDRFTARVSMGYPDTRAELAMLSGHADHDPLEDLRPVSNAAEVRSIIAAVAGIYVSPAVSSYVVELVAATRRSSELRLGGSPRSSLQLLRSAKAVAALAGREYVLPDDVQQLVAPVLCHRVILTPEAQIARRSANDIVADCVKRVPVPRNAPDSTAR